MKMKKYLMTGIAALALCAGFTSCSHDLDSYSPDEIKELEAKKIVNNYEKAFKAYVGGEIASNQTWGFGSYASARTRAEGDEGFYADANEWAAKNGEKWLVPAPLLEGQKARVQYYYQMNRIEEPINPQYGNKDFFMQQVYTGGTDPTGVSPEKYRSVAHKLDGDPDLPGGIHMDYLTAGINNVHVNNFNGGTRSTYPNVLDNDQRVIDAYPNPTEYGYEKNDNNAHHHPDEISLMRNTNTDCFGYANSDDSYARTDRYWMRSAEQIDAYIAEHQADYNAWLEAKSERVGHVIEDKITNDWWGQHGRGFIGFDYDMLPDDNCYAKNGETPIVSLYKDGQSTTNSWCYTVAGDFEHFTDANAAIIVDSKTIPCLRTETNFYCGEVKGMGGEDNHWEWTEVAEYDSDPEADNDESLYLTNFPGSTQSDHKALNLKFIAKKFREGWLPVNGKHLRVWVQVGGCNDHYYSDWIVTFMVGLHYSNTTIIIEDDPDDYSIRVMAEDLSASEESDFDFNDVVLDFFGTENSNVLNVTLQAAGGTLPLRINRDDTKEVHKLFDVPVNYMVNTNWHGSNSATVAEANLPKFTITLTSAINSEDAFLAAVQAIKLEVEKTVSDGTSDAKEWIEMKAEQGKPAAKFAVPVGTQWADERESLKKKYGKFSTWATSAPHIQWWRSDLAGDEDDEE